MSETPFPNLPAIRSMPAISLWQPWASLIEIGAKTFETRSFRIPPRLFGKRVAIQAAMRPCFTGFDQETSDAITEAFGRCSWNHWLPTGVIVATAILVETIGTDGTPVDLFGDYSINRFAWRLHDVRPVRPHIPARGRQMIGWPWEPPEGFVP